MSFLRDLVPYPAPFRVGTGVAKLLLDSLRLGNNLITPNLNPEVSLHDLRLIFELAHFPFPSDLSLFKYIGPVGKLHDEIGILF